MNKVDLLPKSNNHFPLTITYAQGTWKGGAKGFRLVSLARLSHTKSTDGKSTIMNYLVQLLHTRQEVSGDKGALAALQLDDELASIHNAKNVSMAGN